MIFSNFLFVYIVEIFSKIWFVAYSNNNVAYIPRTKIMI